MEGLSIKLRFLRSNIKLLILPFGTICAVLVLFIVLSPIVYTQITDNINLISESNKSSLQLEEKIDSLKQVQTDILPRTNDTIFALPDQNPVLFKWNIVRIFAANQENFNIKEITTTSNPALSDLGSDISSIGINTAVTDASMNQIMEFLQEAVDTFPLTTVNSFAYKMDQDQTNQYEIIISVYWSQLPETITAIKSPIDSLQANEIALLNLISSLRKPEFTQLDVTNYPNRVNPFQ